MFGFGRKKEERPSFRRKMAQQLNGKHLKYVSEKIDNIESVIGKEGAIILKDDVLLVYASSDVVFRCPVTELSMSELLSMEGVILHGRDIEHDGKDRTITAYYTYYRKVEP